eukprot:scaffold43364_cov21-Prasinocladus_malaysianus.AAC.1
MLKIGGFCPGKWCILSHLLYIVRSTCKVDNVLLSLASQEFPSLYSGAPAEPRLSELGMQQAFLFGASVRQRMLLQGLLMETPR